ncbi:excisionase family DNA-binding protein [Balneolaceae bacterium ANBcel3]|nr:excisionase family DNA-binding protein [Balneolaceae bacterium ANBcel3]
MDEICKYLRVSKDTVYKWVAFGSSNKTRQATQFKNQ